MELVQFISLAVLERVRQQPFGIRSRFGIACEVTAGRQLNATNTCAAPQRRSWPSWCAQRDALALGAHRDNRLAAWRKNEAREHDHMYFQSFFKRIPKYFFENNARSKFFQTNFQIFSSKILRDAFFENKGEKPAKSVQTWRFYRQVCADLAGNSP